MEKYDLIIIGAGAAGLAAAYHAGNNKKVIIIEKNSTCGKKLAITGGGRCNFTNTASAEIQLKRIRNGQFLKQAFKAFSPQNTLDWFKSLDVTIKEEEDGKLFSANLSARQIADKILGSALNIGCEIICDSTVKSLLISNGEIEGVVLENETQIYCNKVIICTGGNSYQHTGSTGDGFKLAKQAGHSIITPVPALTPLEISGFPTDKISGVVLPEVELNLFVEAKKTFSSKGILLFTHTGISGPSALSISSLAVRALSEKQEIRLEVDFYPQWTFENADLEFQKLLNLNGKKNVVNILSQVIPSSLAEIVLNLAEVNPSIKGADIKSEMRKKIVSRLKKSYMQINGFKSWKEAMVTAGGIDLQEVSSRTMESKLVKGLYFAGEILDIDGDTGGFNLQAAFSTGVLAVKSACI